MFRSSFNFFCGIFIFVYWNRAAAEWMLKISKVTFLVLLQFICTYFLASYGQVSFNCVIIICQFIHGSILIKIDVAGSRSQTKRNLNTTKKRQRKKYDLQKKFAHKENAVEMYDANLKSACEFEQNLRVNNLRSVFIFQFICFAFFLCLFF